MKTKEDRENARVAKLILDGASGDVDKACEYARERGKAKVEEVVHVIRQVAARRHRTRAA
jgi:hypothetical protein